MNKKHVILILLYFFITACTDKKITIAHSKQNDSLTFYFKQANEYSVPYAKRYAYANKAFSIVSKQKNDSLNRINLFKVANRFYNIAAMDDYKKATQKVLKRSEEAKDIKSLAKAYTYLADCYGTKSMDTVYLLQSKAEKLYRKLNDNFNIAKIILYKATALFNNGDYIGAEKLIYKALKYLKKTPDNEQTYVAYNLMGVIYGELGEYDKAILFGKKALMISEKSGISHIRQLKASSLNNIGLVYQYQKNYKKAISYFELALKEHNLFYDYAFIYITVKGNLGETRLKMNNFEDLPNLFYENLKIADSIQTSLGIISNKHYLSEYYVLKKDTLKAIQFAKEAYILSKKVKLTKYVLENLKQLSLLDHQKSYSYSSEYIRVNDSLEFVERANRNKFARIEFETEELSIEKNKLVEQRKDILYISVGIILLLLLVFIIRFQITKNKELQLQQKANNEIYKLMLEQQHKFEEGKQIEKKRISQELHDGVMGRLSSIRLNLFILSKKTDPETIAKSLVHINEIQEIEKEIRTIAYDLEKNIFSDNIGFTALIQNLFTAIENHSDTVFTFHNDESINWETINSSIRIQIYRILQEALQNIDKYAHASNVVITIAKTSAAIAIEIKDDGIGFNITKVKTGMGLKSMKTRVQEIKGSINITSIPEQGTKINITIPV